VEEREADVEPESTSDSPIIMKTVCLETRKKPLRHLKPLISTSYSQDGPE
jgi:hypothetical protein